MSTFQKRIQQQLAEKENQNLMLYSILYQVLEQQGHDNVASEINQLTCKELNEHVNWYKGNRIYDLLEQRYKACNEQCERVKDKLGIITSYNQDLQNENEQLKQQLTKKEKERHEEWLTGKEWKWECDKLKREQNQTTIEVLEKLKEKALHFLVQDPEKLSGFYVDIDEIDQQIKELKGDSKC